MDVSHSLRHPLPVEWPSRLRLAVVADFLEEGWPSMDLTAEMLADAAARLPGVECQLLRPALWRVPSPARPPTPLQRATGRFIQYPLRLALGPRRGQCFHIADHSYAHLVHLLRRQRVGVYCHDIDAFRALLPGAAASPARRLMARSILSGMRRAAVVFHSTLAVRDELVGHGLLPPERLVHAPYGIAPEFTPEETASDAGVRSEHGASYLLNVGSCIPRKNTAFLLRLLAQLRRSRPGLALLQVGGTWPEEQRLLMAELGLVGAVKQLRGVSRAELAALYRQSAVVLLPSLAEGFGLPLIEALACGSRVLCTDLSVFREVGAGAAEYAPRDDLERWGHALEHLLGAAPSSREEQGRREQRTGQAARFSWQEHARRIVAAYRALSQAEGRT